MGDKPCPQWLAAFAWEVNATVRRHDAMPLFRGMLETWMSDMEAQGSRLAEWEKRYGRYVEEVRKTPALRDSRAFHTNPGDGTTTNGLKWCPLFYGTEIWCWAPAEFRTRPMYVFPFPLRADRGLSRPERYAVLAAIHDSCCEAQEKVSPWPFPVPFTNREDERRYCMFGTLLEGVGELKEGDLPALKAMLDDAEQDIADLTMLPAEIAAFLRRGDFPALTDDEYAKVGAFLSASRRQQTRFSELQTPEGKGKYRRKTEATIRLRTIYDYNTTLRQSAAPTASPGVQPPPNPAPTAAPGHMSKQARALAVKTEHPDWTDAQVAEAAGCHVKSLYRWRLFTAAKSVLKEGRANLPKGRKPKEEPMEAWEDEDKESEGDENS